MVGTLEGKTIAVTGGFGGLGSVVGREALKRGANVAMIDRAPDTLFGAASEFAGKGLVLGNVDLSSQQAAEHAFSSVQEKFGRVDGILNIAGGFVWETFCDNDLDSWDAMYQINVKTAVIASKAALPYLLQAGGSIVCISAGPALKAGIGMGPYAASKAGVARFVESLSEEVKDRNVRVNAVLPSIIDTSTNRRDMPDADFSTWVTPEDLASVLMFLVSDEAKVITGALIPVFNKV